jgi:hypothetical protein
MKYFFDCMQSIATPLEGFVTKLCGCLCVLLCSVVFVAVHLSLQCVLQR